MMHGSARFARAGASLRLLVAAGLGPVQAAGALAVGHCGAYGFAFDFRAIRAARAAALGKCKGDDARSSQR